MKSIWSGGVAPSFLTSAIDQVIRSPYSRGISHQYPLYKGFGGPQSAFERYRTEKNLSFVHGTASRFLIHRACSLVSLRTAIAAPVLIRPACNLVSIPRAVAAPVLINTQSCRSNKIPYYTPSRVDCKRLRKPSSQQTDGKRVRKPSSQQTD
jgi:hypothetical protein